MLRNGIRLLKRNMERDKSESERQLFSKWEDEDGREGDDEKRALNWGSFSGGCLVVELPAAAFRVSLSLSPSFTCSLLNYSSSQLPPWWHYGIHILMAAHGTMNNFLFKAFANFFPLWRCCFLLFLLSRKTRV